MDFGGDIAIEGLLSSQLTFKDGCAMTFDRVPISRYLPSHTLDLMVFLMVDPRRRKGASGLSPCSWRGGKLKPATARAV